MTYFISILKYLLLEVSVVKILQNYLPVIAINTNLVSDKAWCGSEILMVSLFNADPPFNENIFGTL